MKKLLVLLFLFFPLFAFAHGGVDDDELIIRMTKNGFEPKELTVVEGDEVLFINNDDVDHWPASNIHPTHRAYPKSDIKNCNTAQEELMFDACRGIKSGQSYSFQFKEVGEWRFHDHLFPNFSGKITVKGEKGQEENQGFFHIIWNSLKHFFAQGGSSAAAKEDKWVYDSSVKSDSTLIATDNNALYSYVKKFGAKSALEQLFSLEKQFGSCHDNAHLVGRIAYELHGSDSFRECEMMCQSGCYHGAVEEHFRQHGTANLKESINDLCSDNTNSFITHQCKHGIGHGLLAWTNYQLFEALDGCDLLEESAGRSSCYSGVFMENIVQSMAKLQQVKGHTTEYLSDDPHFPCNIVGEKYEPVCYFLQTDRMITLAKGDFSIVASNCAEVANPFSKKMCFESMGRTIGGQNRNNPSAAISICNQIPKSSDRLSCLSGSVQDTFWDPAGQESAVAFCKLLKETEEKAACYQTIFVRAREVLKSIDLKNFCNKVEPTFRKECPVS